MLADERSRAKCGLREDVSNDPVVPQAEQVPLVAGVLITGGFRLGVCGMQSNRSQQIAKDNRQEPRGQADDGAIADLHKRD